MKKMKWVVAGLMLACGVVARESHPNLIVILADDMGIGDIGAFRELYPGGPEDVPAAMRSPKYDGDIDPQFAHKHTPNLDRLAKEGVRCTRAYSASWCAPSRQIPLNAGGPMCKAQKGSQQALHSCQGSRAVCPGIILDEIAD